MPQDSLLFLRTESARIRGATFASLSILVLCGTWVGQQFKVPVSSPAGLIFKRLLVHNDLIYIGPLGCGNFWEIHIWGRRRKHLSGRLIKRELLRTEFGMME